MNTGEPSIRYYYQSLFGIILLTNRYFLKNPLEQKRE